MVLLHLRIAIGGFDTPKSQQRAALDAEILFYPRKQRLVLLQRLLAGHDAPFGDAAIDVLPKLLVELRLVAQFLEHGHVRLDATHHARPGRFRNSLGDCALAKRLAPLLETGRGGGKGGKGVREQNAGTDASLEQRAARCRVGKVGLLHLLILADCEGRQQNSPKVFGRNLRSKLGRPTPPTAPDRADAI
jgi:hypothetical protein